MYDLEDDDLNEEDDKDFDPTKTDGDDEDGVLTEPKEPDDFEIAGWE
jgi:hypothetical protein